MSLRENLASGLFALDFPLLSWAAALTGVKTGYYSKADKAIDIIVGEMASSPTIQVQPHETNVDVTVQPAPVEINGMSLRDALASATMAQLTPAIDWQDHGQLNKNAKLAYATADAMLAAREE